MKRLLPFAAFIAVVAAGAYLLAPAVLSKDRIKRAVTEELSSRAGRPVTFSGEPTVTVFPAFGFRLDHVVVANAPGLGDEPFAVIRSIRGTLKLLPLLFGRVEPGRIQLVSPRFHLSVNESGRANWDVGGPVAGAPLDRQIASALRRSGNRAFGRIQITDGFLTYDNRQTNAHSEVSSVDLNLTWRNPDDPVSASGTFRWRGETVEVSGALARPLDFFSGKVSTVSISLNAAPLRFSFQGSAFAAGGAGLDGDLAVTSPSVRRALDWLGRGIGDGPTLGAGALRAKARIAGSAVTLSDAGLELDGNAATGSVRIALEGERPRLHGTLAFDSLDVSPYLEAIRASLAGSSDWNPVAIDLPLLRHADLDFRISAREVVVGRATLGAAAASAVGTGGRIAFDIGEMQVYGGTLEATVTADLTGPEMRGAIRAKLTEVPTRPALGALAGIETVDGIASAEVDVHGRADTWNALLRNAAGSVSISLVDCAIAGLDLGQIARAAEGTVESPDKTVFKSIAGTLALQGGTMTTEDLIADGTAYAIAIEGTASLLRPTIKGRGTLAIRDPAGDGNTAAREIPFVIGGSWLHPLVSPDIDRILLRKEASRQGEMPASWPAALLPQ